MLKPSERADPLQFSTALYEVMTQINSGIAELELYEFRYALDNLIPAAGWEGVSLETMNALEDRISQTAFFTAIQTKPRRNNQVVLDETIVQLSQMLFAGLVSGAYPPDWVLRHFYFDIRAFAFFVRTQYFTPHILSHFGGRPYRAFEPTQLQLEPQQDVGYREFLQANQAIDSAFVDAIQKLIAVKGTPLLVTLVGPTAAGKSEIVARMQQALMQAGQHTTTIEMDNFLKDREYRDGRPMGIEVIHYDLFKSCIADLLSGKPARMTRYDFVLATSSHDLDGKIRPSQTMIDIQPADIILLEGNFPFHIPEVAPLIDIKVVYLTDDPIRLKRKWRRDVDYRKKYTPAYLANRFFRTQFLRVHEIYQPMMETCEMVVDTTGAALWVRPDIAALLG